MRIIYRLSDNGYPKEKFAFATKQYCLHNFLWEFKFEQIHLLVDFTNLKDETKKMVESEIDELRIVGNEVNLKYYTGGSSAGSWREAWRTFIDCSISDNEIIYFVEDDYLHRKESNKLIYEGIKVADYVSLYDHADKYIPASKGGNMFIGEDGAEVTKVLLTKSSHWKLTNSTTMTFASTKKTLLEDKDIWERWTLGTHPHDFQAFIELRQKGRSLITPIPGYSTHCEPAWASPLIDWSNCYV